jgi:hypothetical protein
MVMNKEIKSVEIAELCFNVLSQNMPGWTKGHHKDLSGQMITGLRPPEQEAGLDVSLFP